MTSSNLALGLLLPAGVLLLGACTGLVSQKDGCNSDTDCNPGRTCSPAKVCTNVPVEAGALSGLEGGSVPNAVEARSPDQVDASFPYEVDASPPGVEAGRPPACDLPEGTVRSLTSLADAYQVIVGRWLFCSGGPSDTLDRPIEFTADRHWSILVPDATGQLVHASGFAALSESGTFAFVEPAPLGDGGAAWPLTTLFLRLDDGQGGSLSSNFAYSDVPSTATPAKAKMLFGLSVYVTSP